MSKPTPDNVIILNVGLELAMEFGSDWLKPIQERLVEKYPALTTKELDEYNKVCRAAMSAGHAFIYKKLESTMKERRQITRQALSNELRETFSSKYAWINADNFSKLLSQGVYYAYKDGLHLCLTD